MEKIFGDLSSVKYALNYKKEMHSLSELKEEKLGKYISFETIEKTKSKLTSNKSNLNSNKSIATKEYLYDSLSLPVRNLINSINFEHHQEEKSNDDLNKENNLDDFFQKLIKDNKNITPKNTKTKEKLCLINETTNQQDIKSNNIQCLEEFKPLILDLVESQNNINILDGLDKTKKSFENEFNNMNNSGICNNENRKDNNYNTKNENSKTKSKFKKEEIEENDKETIIFKYLPKDITTLDIERIIDENKNDGTIIDIRLIQDENGNSRGMAFVDIKSKKDANVIIENIKKNTNFTCLISNSFETNDSKTLFISNIPFDTNETMLRDIFKSYKINDIRIVKNQNTGEPKGFALLSLKMMMTHEKY
jgi:hypothetical protein